MEYLIVIYKNTPNVEIDKTLVLSEREMFNFIQKHIDSKDLKFTVNKIINVLDFS